MDHYGYVDSSVMLRKLLREDGAISDLMQWQLVSSQLLDVEVRRNLLRYHAEHLLGAAVFARRLQEWYVFRDSIALVPVSNGILHRAAEPFPTC